MTYDTDIRHIVTNGLDAESTMRSQCCCYDSATDQSEKKRIVYYDWSVVELQQHY